MGCTSRMGRPAGSQAYILLNGGSKGGGEEGGGWGAGQGLKWTPREGGVATVG